MHQKTGLCIHVQLILLSAQKISAELTVPPPRIVFHCKIVCANALLFVPSRRRPDYEIRDYEPSAVTEAFQEGQMGGEIPPSGEKGVRRVL